MIIYAADPFDEWRYHPENGDDALGSWFQGRFIIATVFYKCFFLDSVASR